MELAVKKTYKFPRFFPTDLSSLIPIEKGQPCTQQDCPFPISSDWPRRDGLVLHVYPHTITYKALSRELKEMEADGLVRRKEYPQVPPKVEYGLTEKGASLYPIMEQMCQWGTEHSRNK